MAYLTKTPFGYYVNRQFVLPTPAGDAIVAAAGRGRHLGYYTQRNFVLPTSSSIRQNQVLAAVAQASKKACSCNGACGHCSGRKRSRRLGWLGDDGDTGAYDISTGLPYSAEPTGTIDFTTGLPGATEITGNVDPSLINAEGDPSVGYPATTGTTSTAGQSTTNTVAAAIAAFTAKLLGTPTTSSALTAQQQAALAAQNPLTTPIAGLGLSPLTLGAIGLGVVLVISVAKSRKKRR
jgi:hypothetical protein